MQLATADSPFPLLAAFGAVTWGERADAKTRVRGINLAAGAGAWAEGFQAWEGTREKPAATTNSRWDASSFGFTGREHELDSGLVYARARYLNPSTGQWDRPDPLGFVDGPNRFVYVLNAPVLRTDPLGLFLPALHEAITRQAFAGLVRGPDLEDIARGAVDADWVQYQYDDFRHGMRSANQTLEEGARAWADFFDGQMALAISGVNSYCGPARSWGFWQLGVGAHAVEDYFSPPHRMQVMSWAHPFDHRSAESHLTIESGPAQEAARSAREYAQLFMWMVRLPMSMDRQYMAQLAWGLFGQNLYIEAITYEP